MSQTIIRIGLAGAGNIGSGVIELLETNQNWISQRLGFDCKFEIASILVKQLEKPRDSVIPKQKITDNLETFINYPELDLVIELIGGTDQSFQIVSRALSQKKPVITGNKALLAERGTELFALSKAQATPLYFEAAVAGGIPIIRALKESLIGNQIKSCTAIINGTSNYILEQMTEHQTPFEIALKKAQELGYAEADPALDINGWDAGHKILLLLALAYGFIVDPKKINVWGIKDVLPLDVALINELGYCIKLLSILKQHPNGAIECRTQPSLIPKNHILSSVRGVFNAVDIKGDFALEGLFYGHGAGKRPTASSVVSDLAQATCFLKTKTHFGFLPYAENKPIVPIEKTSSAYYVRLNVIDQLGVLAEITSLIAEAEIGLAGTHSPINPDQPDADFSTLVLVIHTCPFGQLSKALKAISQLESVTSQPVVFRIESFENNLPQS